MKSIQAEDNTKNKRSWFIRNDRMKLERVETEGQKYYKIQKCKDLDKEDDDPQAVSR